MPFKRRFKDTYASSSPENASVVRTLFDLLYFFLPPPKKKSRFVLKERLQSYAYNNSSNLLTCSVGLKPEHGGGGEFVMRRASRGFLLHFDHVDGIPTTLEHKREGRIGWSWLFEFLFYIPSLTREVSIYAELPILGNKPQLQKIAYEKRGVNHVCLHSLSVG